MAAKERCVAESSDDLIICHRYQLLRKIGNGTFGTVLLGIDLFDHSEVAMKLEAKTKSGNKLFHEYYIYNNFKEQMGFPEVLWCGNQGDFNILVMELLGPSLEDLFGFCGRIFSLKTVLLLADQLLSRMQALHLAGIIHRDIKPENFAMGLGAKQNIVHLIDMGLCKKYLTSEEREVHTEPKKYSFCGTIRFASPNAHNGFALSRRDDLISLGYTLIYFLKGELPWFKYKTHSKQQYTELAGQMKSQLSVEELCVDCPEEFKTFLKYCYELKIDETPDYGRMRQNFWLLFVKKQFIFDNVFDWNVYRYGRNLERERDGST
ncbi:unnamed protein product [Litomosoides sigmodontis]|uniref:Protein kinase domain-containing protein n=1 Tax=Litomosoides sigmodontis TaxID=42156 RepID=A0A3P6TUZ0_LITSI|nr:unnamed protein product [Litomosoides sigmodontis]